MSKDIYNKSYSKLKALVDEGKSWKEIYLELNSDESHLKDIFIRLIEDKEGLLITSSKQLQELSKITEVGGIFIEGMYNRYFSTLEEMLINGCKYKDLLLIDPKNFNLPETWSGTLAEDKNSSLLWAICLTYLIDEPIGLIQFPSLRAIANEIEAPYSVLMDAFNISRLNNKIERKEDIIFSNLRKAVKQYITEQPKAWREERLLNPMKGSWTKEDAKRTEEEYLDMFLIYFKTLFIHEVAPERPLTEMQKSFIEHHKETIYKYFKRYLDEAKDIYKNEFNKAYRTAFIQTIGYSNLP